MGNVKVGIIGFGTVGAGVASCLLTNNDVILRRTGIRAELTRIVDIDITSDRGVDFPYDMLSTDASALIDEVDIVVELVGGVDVARDFIIEALEKGKSVVTANKALLAKCGEELFAIAEKSKADLYYEASVAGGIPVIKVLREGLVANRIEKIIGILNGTCNYILTKMEKENADFDSVLKEAQDMGYAEADPSLDIDGFDTAHKTVVLASLVYGKWFETDSVFVEGIRDIELCDLRFTAELGYRIKLLGIIKQEDEDVEIRVHPTLIPQSSLLSGISGVYNGVMISCDVAGDSLYYGKGAGRDATASAVVADIIDVAHNLESGSPRKIPESRTGQQFGRIIEMNDIKSHYYIRLQVADQTEAAKKVSHILEEQGVSISRLLQRNGQQGDTVSLLILTHAAKESSVNNSIIRIKNLECVKDKVVKIRIEDI